eukprot:Hpha_TRINITY_DN7863_c0_g1::TRINITY_DN7863_c0_g1_i1::g.185715::m.185715
MLLQPSSAWLDVGPDEALGLSYEKDPSSGAVMIRGITPGSPAERANIPDGAVVLEVGGMQIRNPDDIAVAVQEWREANEELLEVVFADLDEEAPSIDFSVQDTAPRTAYLECEPGEPVGLKYERDPDTSAVIIGSVVPGSPADRTGLPAGAVLLEVDGQSIKRGDDVQEAVIQWRARGAEEPLEVVYIDFERSSDQARRAARRTRRLVSFGAPGVPERQKRRDSGMPGAAHDAPPRKGRRPSLHLDFLGDSVTPTSGSSSNTPVLPSSPLHGRDTTLWSFSASSSGTSGRPPPPTPPRRPLAHPQIRRRQQPYLPPPLPPPPVAGHLDVYADANAAFAVIAEESDGSSLGSPTEQDSRGVLWSAIPNEEVQSHGIPPTRVYNTSHSSVLVSSHLSYAAVPQHVPLGRHSTLFPPRPAAAPSRWGSTWLPYKG